MNLVVLVVVLMVLVGVLAVEERRSTTKTMNTTITTNYTSTTAQININQLLLITPLPVQQLLQSPPPILFYYGYGCEGSGRLLVVVVAY